MPDGETPDQFEDMLPGFVNGSLSNAARRAVEVELARSPELRAQLAQEHKLADAIKSAGAQLITAAQQQREARLAALLKRLPSADPNPDEASEDGD